MKTLVLSMENDLYERLKVYSEGCEKNIKFLINIAARDYVSKREARTRRAERQKEGKGR